MSGYTVTTAGACTASFSVTGDTGKNPPYICGTNTGYHSKIFRLSLSLKTGFIIHSVYVEFGAASSDDIELKTTFDAVAKQWNILTRQISCTAEWK